MWHPRIVLITAIQAFGEACTVERTRLLCQSFPPGAVVVQLRDKELGARELYRVGQRLRSVTREYRQGFVVNDRVDLASLLEADGVHLGERSLEPELARELLGGAAWISRACHAPEQVAASSGANAVLLSPVLATRKGRSPLGLRGLRRARAAIVAGQPERASEPPVQLFALGGVALSSLHACEMAGADGIAMMEAAWRGEVTR